MVLPGVGGLRADAVGQNAPLGDLGDAVQMIDRALTREGETDGPVHQHRIGGSDDVLQRAHGRHSRRCHRQPLVGTDVGVTGHQTHGVGVGGQLIHRNAQVAPRRRRADVDRIDSSQRVDASVGLLLAVLDLQDRAGGDDAVGVDVADSSGRGDREERCGVVALGQ